MPHFLRLLKCPKLPAARNATEKGHCFTEPSTTKIGRVYGVLMLKYLYWNGAKHRWRRLFLHRRNRFSPRTFVPPRKLHPRHHVSSFQSPFALWIRELFRGTKAWNRSASSWNWEWKSGRNARRNFSNEKRFYNRSNVNHNWQFHAK